MLSTTTTTLLLLATTLLPDVSAHGFVRHITVNGDRKFTGPQPDGRRRDTPSIIRQITSAFPNYGADNPALNCGPGAMRASEVADIMPGDLLEFDWRAYDLNRWPHNTGPHITYMASCGDVPCNEFDSRDARWFKIDQHGKKDNNREWFQADIMAGGLASARIPRTLAPGNYLVRHEIIALHIASDLRGAEFYPACAQFRVGGNGTGLPSDDELVRFPGGYRDEDKGIRLNAFTGAPYEFPGPRVARLAAVAGDDDNDDKEGSGAGQTPTGTTTTSGSPKPTKSSDSPNPGNTSGSTSPSKANEKKCRLKKGSKSVAARAAEPTAAGEVLEGEGPAHEGYQGEWKRDIYPRHVSRVMRRLVGLDYRMRSAA